MDPTGGGSVLAWVLAILAGWLGLWAIGDALAGLAYRSFLALRYLLTRPIHLLGMAGVTVGVWALIVVVSIFSGFLKVVGEHLRSAGADIVVSGIPAAADPAGLMAVVRQDPNVAGCAGRLVHYGLLHRPGENPGPLPLLGRSSLQGSEGPFLFVLGVDPEQESTTTSLAEWLTAVPEPELRVRDLADPLAAIDGVPAIVLGRDRMRQAGLRVGDRVVLTTGRLERAADGGRALDPLSPEFAVAGAFHTRHVGFEGNTTFVALDVLRGLLLPGRPHAVHELSVRLHDADGQALAATADRLQRQIGLQIPWARSPGPPYVETWRERNRSILLSVEHQRSLMKIVLVVIMVVAAFLMFATLSMMVAEKTGDIGILAALGGTPLGVMQVFLLCGLAITAAGLLSGVLVGCLSAIYLDDLNNLLRAWFDIDLFPTKVYNLDRVPYDLDPLWIAQVCGLALIVGGLVAAVPALRAARHDPLVSLRGA